MSTPLTSRIYNASIKTSRKEKKKREKFPNRNTTLTFQEVPSGYPFHYRLTKKYECKQTDTYLNLGSSCCCPRWVSQTLAHRS